MVRGVIPALLVGALLAGPLAVGPCGAAPGEGLRSAAALLLAGDAERARSAFGREAELDRYSAVAVAGAGAADLFAGRTEQGARLFRESLALRPSLAAAHMGAGAAACIMQDYRAAMGHYQRALVGGMARPALALAGEAYAACALGLHDTALERARTALATDPQQPVARYAYAAAALARGDAGPAAQLDGAALATPGPAAPITLASCLLAPGTAYWQTHALDDQARLARLPALTAPTASRSEASRATPPPADDFRLLAPTEGQVLTGAAPVEVALGAGLDLDHVVVLVNDSFAGVSYTAPHRVTLDTRLFAGGAAEVRADGYDRQGAVIRSAHVLARIQNSNRSVAPEETAARRAVAELLEELLLPPLSPVAGRRLAGHGLLKQGRPDLAAAAFEGAYAGEPDIPGLRTDLLLAYDALGVRPAPTAPEVYALPRGINAVALTFDDGPHPLITPWILDQLDREGVKATFFVVGKQAMLYPELVREIRRRGHALGSHSYAHHSYRHMTPVECEQDMVKSRLAIREACGETVTLLRPPGGYYDAAVKAAAGALGFTTVFWTCNITSFPGQDGARIASEIARRSSDGGIILLHNGEDETLDALPHLVPELRKRGARFMTISPQVGQAGLAERD